MSIKELLAINKRIRESEAYARVHRIDDISPSVAIFEGNYRELSSCIAACERDWKVFDIRRRQDLRDLLNKL